MNHKFNAILAFCLCVVACGDGSTETNTTPNDPNLSGTESVDVDGCTFEHFELDITQGPSAGLKVEGKLLLAKDASTAGALSGGFLWNGQNVLVTGAYSDDNVSLHVDLGDGRFVEGYGPIQNGDYCKVLTGVALGPTAASDNADPTKFDQGHWLAELPDYLEPLPVLVLIDENGGLISTGGDINTLNISQECKDKAKAACGCCSVAGTDSCRVKAGNNCDAGQMGNIAQDSAGNMFSECTAGSVYESILQIGCKLKLLGPLKN